MNRSGVACPCSQAPAPARLPGGGGSGAEPAVCGSPRMPTPSFSLRGSGRFLPPVMDLVPSMASGLGVAEYAIDEQHSVLLSVWELESKNAGIWSARDQISASGAVCGICAKPRQIGLRAHSAAPAHPWGPARHPQRPRRPPPPQARLGRQPCPHCFIHPWHRHCDPRTGSPIFGDPGFRAMGAPRRRGAVAKGRRRGGSGG